MLKSGWLAGGVGGVIGGVVFSCHSDPNADMLAFITFSFVGGLISTLLWLYFVKWLDVPPVPKPSRAELIEATRVQLECRIAEATEVCGSADAEVVRDLRTELTMYNYLVGRVGA